jgi:hypothetical protein
MSYIFNKNHNRTHLPGCRAIGQMNFEKNAVLVDEPQGHSCGWCGCGRGSHTKTKTRVFDGGLDPYIGEKVCHDPQLRQRFKDHGCPCGSHTGDVRMYPHNAGIPVQGEEGLWWVYFHCFQCGHDTSFDKLPETFSEELVSEVI